MAALRALVLSLALLAVARAASLPASSDDSAGHRPAPAALRQLEDDDPAQLGMPLPHPAEGDPASDADSPPDAVDPADPNAPDPATDDTPVADPAAGPDDAQDAPSTDAAADDKSAAEGPDEDEEASGAENADDGGVAQQPDSDVSQDKQPAAEPGADATATDVEGASTSSEGAVDPGHNVPEGNLTAAFAAFTLLQMVEVDDDTSFKLVPIFQNLTFVGGFENNPTSADVTQLDQTVDDASWYNDGPYADRISFQYTYTPEAVDYAWSEPVIAVDTDMGIEPRLQDERNDPASGVGSFTVLYRCKNGGVEKSYISLHMQVTKDHSVDTTWIKVCGHGRNEHLNFGFMGIDDTVTLFNADGTYGIEEQHSLEVGPLQLSTALSAELTPPAWQMDFLDPFVESDSPLVTVSLRDTIKAGTLSTDGPTKFSVLYKCAETTAKATIKFTLGIPPWDSITASWRKTCGGTHSEALLIGTSGAGSFEVMQDGELNANFNVSENTSVEGAYGKVEEIDGSMNSMRYFITNSDDTSEIHIQTIATTMSNPEVVSTIVEVPFSATGSYLGPSGGTIPRKETRSLKLRFVCKKVGESLVLVTLPTVKYKNVEFGFLKHCLAPTVRHHSGFLQTAGSIMGAILVLAVMGGVAFWVHMRRRAQGAKYAPVSTTDRIP